MARILVTGGAGYVGAHATRLASAAGHSCVVLDSLVNGHRSFVQWGPLIEADIRDGAAVAAALKEHRIDAVMHFAALAYVGQSVTAPADYYDVNVNGTRVLLDAMVAGGVRHIVLSSSCAVYGEPEAMPIRETTRPQPINPYGFTKLVCERMIDDYAAAYGMSSVKLRYFNAAGADPQCRIGEAHDPETHLIPLVLDAAIGRRPAIAVFGTDYATPDGSAIRDYVHVDDLGDAHVRALAHLLGGGASLTVNLGTGGGISVLEVIALARQVTGLPIAVRHEDRRAGDPARLVAEPGEALSRLGWKAQRSDPATLVTDAWRWHRRKSATSTG